MSLPNIPDIHPDINLKFEDVINMLLASIAMEEESLAKLMDAETNKISCVLGDCKHHDCTPGGKGQAGCHRDSLLHDALQINKSVDDTIKDMIKFQMLLQFKLENIQELLPCTTTTTTTSTTTTTTTTCTVTTTHTTTCTTSTCSTTTKKECCCCSLTGTGKGYVPNCCDELHHQLVTLYAFLYSSDLRNRTVRYSVGENGADLLLRAAGCSVKMQCPGCCSDKLVIYGKGTAEKPSEEKPDCPVQVDFILTVGRKISDNLEFRMEIKSDKNPGFNHDSGFVQVRDAISNLRFEEYCYF